MVKMDGNGRRCDTPGEVDPKKPFYNPHEIHFASFTQKTTEESFNSRVFREVNKVMDIESKGKR